MTELSVRTYYDLAERADALVGAAAAVVVGRLPTLYQSGDGESAEELALDGLARDLLDGEAVVVPAEVGDLEENVALLVEAEVELALLLPLFTPIFADFCLRFLLTRQLLDYVLQLKHLCPEPANLLGDTFNAFSRRFGHYFALSSVFLRFLAFLAFVFCNANVCFTCLRRDSSTPRSDLHMNVDAMCHSV